MKPSQDTNQQRKFLFKCKLSTFLLEALVNSILKERFSMINPSIRCDSCYYYESGDGLDSSEISIYNDNLRQTLKGLGLSNGSNVHCNDFDKDGSIIMELLDSNEESFEINEVLISNENRLKQQKTTENQENNIIGSLKRKKDISHEIGIKLRKLM
ncbi:unnamed protein product [Blepharisma stoltei]|uniref:Ubiquitin/SUMO-activating enzyme ubiquitin-like domain-containing protein n=1 Tax=Blepharisma stoltei TaxID=1481888 RepID=A0AAU9JSL0_9CILI|nr:unnamed protein product [Blepharisma stoltei]